MHLALQTRVVTVAGQMLQFVVKDKPYWIESHDLKQHLAFDQTSSINRTPS